MQTAAFPSQEEYDAAAEAVSTTLRKDFTVAAQAWSWTHGLGYNPAVDVYNTTGEKLLAYVEHTDTNTLTVEHAYNETGYVLTTS